MEFTHFTHPHPLKLYIESRVHRLCVCGSFHYGPIYTCNECSRFFLGKNCAELPQEIQSTYHLHPFTLSQSKGLECDACGHDASFAYRCKQCNLNLDSRCALLKPTVDEGQDQLLHPFHFHPLVLQEYPGCHCRACGEPNSDGLYGCKSCRFYLHQSCAELPLEFQSPYHPHPLMLGKSEGFTCDACQEDGYSFAYRCKQCNLNLDSRCALLKPTVDEGQDQLLHPFHFHPLVLQEYPGCHCRACGEPNSDGFYGCKSCCFYLHQSCAKLPLEFQSPYHPHPLMLGKSEEFTCDACQKDSYYSFANRCKQCNLKLDSRCALLKSTIDEGQNQLLHFFHFHPLVFMEKPNVPCGMCGRLNSNCVYGCEPCKFFLHQSCAELPQEFQSPYHLHPLTWTSKRVKWRSCDACKKGGGISFAYRCEQCDLNLDSLCASLKPTIDEAQVQLLRSSHFHPLVFEEKHDVDCRICEKRSSNGLYGCQPCNFYLHQSCSRLQQNLQHSRHRCPLSLTRGGIGPPSVCDLCFADVDMELCYYKCLTCEFNIDISCALFPALMEFHHFIHDHSLTLRAIKLDDDAVVDCTLCEKRCLGLTFVCCKCRDFSLHQSCFDFPQNIHHPFHPQHPLNLTKPIRRVHSFALNDLMGCCNGIEDLYGPYPECKVCFQICSGFCYHCDECHNFDLHLSCVDKLSTIKYQSRNPNSSCLDKISTINYQGHHHNLLFIPSPSSKESLNCHACGGTNSRILSHMFRCFECDFFLHFECGPLPCTIEYEGHNLHPLTLTDSPVVAENEDKDGMDATEFVCDVCEKVTRDPRLPVYYCREGCRYLAEFECVISEVIRSLLGEHGEAELKTPINHVPGKVISKGMVEGIDLQEAGKDSETKERKLQVTPTLTYRENLCSIMEEGREELLGVIYAAKDDSDRDSSEPSPLISKEASSWFLKLVDDVTKFPNFVGEASHEYPRLWKEKVVRVGDHLVPWSLAPILEDLCAKYGDIGVGSALRISKLNTYFIVMLCATIKSMYGTRVVDISKDHLANWWVNLKILKIANFKVQFVFDRLKRIMDAYNGIQICDEAKTKREELHQEIQKASQAIEQLKAELDILKERSKTIELEPEFSGHEAECLREASALKWKVAGEGLL